MSETQTEYAQAGVDYGKIAPFKERMIAVGKRTLSFPRKRHVMVDESILHSHGAVYEVMRPGPHSWCKTQEGLGNKNWIAEWMYKSSGLGKSFYDQIGIDTVMMAANDNIVQGALPVIYADEVAPGQDTWFEDPLRAQELAEGFYEGCRLAGAALGCGESPAYKYLVNPVPPIESCPVLSGSITGIIWNPEQNKITGKKLRPGNLIIGVTSSGFHANGASLIIKRALTLPDSFMTKVNGRTLGEEALIPTRSYVDLVEALQTHLGDLMKYVTAFLPGTGGGVAKLAFDKREYTYRIHDWVEVPPLFQFMREIGVSLYDCLTTFNWGVGAYIFIDPCIEAEVLEIGRNAGYELKTVGRVEEGPRQTIFGPERDLVLPPPGD